MTLKEFKDLTKDMPEDAEMKFTIRQYDSDEYPCYIEDISTSHFYNRIDIDLIC